MLKEPLVHFLVIGAGLFAVDAAWNPPARPADASIVVSAETERALEQAWDDQSGRPLSDEERRAVIAAWVRNEALYREALRLELDRGDAIVRRRLVQKMEFLVDGRLDAVDPDDAALRSWFAERAEDYVEPARASFVHRFFSRTRRGDAAFADAAAALDRLADAGPEAPVDADPFVGPPSLTSATRSRIHRDFGDGFATAVVEQAPGRWAGPFASSHGFHLVYVLDHQDEAPARFEDRRREVLEDWRDQERERQRRAAIDAIVARYVDGAP